jgi:para-nitrobenzyl esterase
VGDYAASFGTEHAEALLAKYPPANYASPSLAEIAMAQGMKSCVARLLDRQWSKYVPVYAYEFADRTAPSYFPDLSYPMRATFARSGDPNRGSTEELPSWQRYSAEADNLLVLNSPEPKMTEGYGKANDCASWDSVLVFK